MEPTANGQRLDGPCVSASISVLLVGGSPHTVLHEVVSGSVTCAISLVSTVSVGQFGMQHMLWLYSCPGFLVIQIAWCTLLHVKFAIIVESSAVAGRSAITQLVIVLWHHVVAEHHACEAHVRNGIKDQCQICTL